MYSFTRKVNCFTCKVKCFTHKDKCLRVKHWINEPFVHIGYTTNYAYKCDNVSRVKPFVLRIKYLTLRVKLFTLHVKQCIKI